jgi:phosphate transport system protein
MLLAERGSLIGSGKDDQLWVREIRKLVTDGHHQDEARALIRDLCTTPADPTPLVTKLLHERFRNLAATGNDRRRRHEMEHDGTGLAEISTCQQRPEDVITHVPHPAMSAPTYDFRSPVIAIPFAPTLQAIFQQSAMPTHLEESMQREVDRIRGKLTEMSALGEKALRDCIKALTDRNRQTAYAIILRDQYIDELEKEVDRLCLEFIVRQQPVAGLLRFAYATIKVNLELERVGDYAESIARQTLKLLDLTGQVPMDRILEIADLSIPMLRDATRAFVNQDAELARRTIDTEQAVDLLKSKLNNYLIALFREDKLPFEALNPLIMISRRFERVSDQARNICMETLYMCTGEYVKHAGAEAFRVLFIDDHNACRSQMAEAIARSLNQPRFIFTSAGLEPQSIDPMTLGFLKEKNLDVACLAPKAINQVPNLEHYHVIVALAPEAGKAFPRKPRKLAFLDWSVKDPSQTQGTQTDVTAAYESTYQFIHEHIHDLVGAILGENINI